MGGGDSVPANYSAVFSRMVGVLQQSPSSLRLGMVVNGVTPLRATTGGAVIGVQVRCMLQRKVFVYHSGLIGGAAGS
jgi:energy-converting hydrogenase Eha subunit G